MARRLNEDFCGMYFNGIERVVDVTEPTQDYSGVYNVDARYSGNLKNLDTKCLFEILSEVGLVYSGIVHDIQYGFNDLKVVGDEEEVNARIAGKSGLWIGLDGNLVNLEVLPKTFRALTENHLDYAERILGKVVEFVENSQNYF